MRVQPLGSGSKGNSTLVRAGETNLLIDLGFSARRAYQLLEECRVLPQSVEHLLVTHGHLDHTRGAGTFARKTGAEVVCVEAIMRNTALVRAKRFRRLPVGGTVYLGTSDDPLGVTALKIQHDADPTVALELVHRERRLSFVTDMGLPDAGVAERLANPSVLVLEFNHDAEMLANGPYPEALKRRISGPGGHLSNAEAAWMLERMVGDDLHTLVLAHLSENNNTPELAREAAEATLRRAGRSDVNVIVAEQSTPLAPIDV